MTDDEKTKEAVKSTELMEALSTVLLDRNEPGIRALGVFLNMVCEMANAMGVPKEHLLEFIKLHKPEKVKEGQN